MKGQLRGIHFLEMMYQAMILRRKRGNLEEMKAYNFFSSMGKRMSDGFIQIYQKKFQSDPNNTISGSQRCRWFVHKIILREIHSSASDCLILLTISQHRIDYSSVFPSIRSGNFGSCASKKRLSLSDRCAKRALALFIFH